MAGKRASSGARSGRGGLLSAGLVRSSFALVCALGFVARPDAERKRGLAGGGGAATPPGRRVRTGKEGLAGSPRRRGQLTAPSSSSPAAAACGAPQAAVGQTFACSSPLRAALLLPHVSARGAAGLLLPHGRAVGGARGGQTLLSSSSCRRPGPAAASASSSPAPMVPLRLAAAPVSPSRALPCGLPPSRGLCRGGAEAAAGQTAALLGAAPADLGVLHGSLELWGAVAQRLPAGEEFLPVLGGLLGKWLQERLGPCLVSAVLF